MQAFARVEPAAGDSPAWTQGPQLMRSNGAPIDLLPAAHVLVQEPSALAVVVSRQEAASDRVGFVSREGLDGRMLQSAALERSKALPVLGPGEAIAIHAWPGWWFGTRVADEVDSGAWLLMSEAHSAVLDGTGWALLQTVTRALSGPRAPARPQPQRRRATPVPAAAAATESA
jgi:hypothetical protein